jgi:Ser/Thr protein kinase RdoA (MazF antagonist)
MLSALSGSRLNGAKGFSMASSSLRVNLSVEQIRQLIRFAGFNPDRVYEVQKGYRNFSIPFEDNRYGMLNIILYKNEPKIVTKIRAANHTSDFLASRGFPCRTSQSSIINIKTSKVVRHACVYDYLAGQTIPWEAYTMKHIKLLGATMSNLHSQLNTSFEPRRHDKATTVLAAQISVMLMYFSDPQVINAIKNKLGVKLDNGWQERFIWLLEKCNNFQLQQALHMDFVRGNILFKYDVSGLRISGILDFEKTAVGHPVIDVARSIAFLSVDCKSKPEHKVRKYFLSSGYNKQGANCLPRLTVKHGPKTIDILDELVSLFLMYDFYKFLRHNPYEFLSQNEHYKRTKALLLQRMILLDDASI